MNSLNLTVDLFESTLQFDMMINKELRTLFLTVIISAIHLTCNRTAPPQPVEPIPNAQQVAWQEMEFYAFIHFSLNTFTNQEWGYGDKPSTLFNPTQFDARQWARVIKEAGMKGVIITAKHHDGFCLWPSKFTDYSVAQSPWKDGHGDVVGELAAACKEYGLKLGIYLSPWDRNHPDYGKPEYITYFRNQLTELLTNYGDLFEVWFDGANGGDGYYGGANETRRVDKRSYYDWPNTHQLIRKLQPNAIIWSDAGPDARWVGNEHGYAYETTWSMLLRDSVYGGMPEYAKQYAPGQEHGTHWVPAEADVSIRPGWFYHQSEDDKVKPLSHLLDIYYKSVGQNSTLLLNLPVDNRGLIHENDEAQLKKLAAQLKLDFAQDLAAGKPVRASHIRGDDPQYSASNINDADSETFWTTDDSTIQATWTIDLGEPTKFNRIIIQEYIPLGQRIKSFLVEAFVNGQWQSIGQYSTIGYKRILRFDPLNATKLKFSVLEARACPVISNVQIFNAPVIVDVPVIKRSKDGLVRLERPEPGTDIYFTTDGTNPSINAKAYSTPFLVESPTEVKALCIDPITGRQSEIAAKAFDKSKKKWALIPNDESLMATIDDDQQTFGKLSMENGTAQMVVHFGEEVSMNGFTYTPDQRRYAKGIILQYQLFGSIDGQNWFPMSDGTFANIENNPIQQEVRLAQPHQVKQVKFVVNKVSNNASEAIIAEFGIITNTL